MIVLVEPKIRLMKCFAANKINSAIDFYRWNYDFTLEREKICHRLAQIKWIFLLAINNLWVFATSVLSAAIVIISKKIFWHEAIFNFTKISDNSGNSRLKKFKKIWRICIYFENFFFSFLTLNTRFVLINYVIWKQSLAIILTHYYLNWTKQHIISNFIRLKREWNKQ